MKSAFLAPGAGTSQESMQKNKISKFIEIGPGKVLSGLIKRIDRNLISLPISSIEDTINLNLND